MRTEAAKRSQQRRAMEEGERESRGLVEADGRDGEKASGSEDDGFFTIKGAARKRSCKSASSTLRSHALFATHSVHESPSTRTTPSKSASRAFSSSFAFSSSATRAFLSLPTTPCANSQLHSIAHSTLLFTRLW